MTLGGPCILLVPAILIERNKLTRQL
jgi:hypothetical protein